MKVRDSQAAPGQQGSTDWADGSGPRSANFLSPAPLRWGLAVAALLLVVLAAFALGKFPIGPSDLARIVWARISGSETGLPPAMETVIWNIRLSRIGAALLVGTVLSAAGAAYQGMFRNPLGAGIALIKTVADPTTQLPSITFWLMGGLNAITASDLLGTAPALLLGLLPMALLRWRMNLLSLDDDEAEALGVPVGPTSVVCCRPR